MSLQMVAYSTGPLGVKSRRKFILQGTGCLAGIKNYQDLSFPGYMTAMQVLGAESTATFAEKQQQQQQQQQQQMSSVRQIGASGSSMSWSYLGTIAAAEWHGSAHWHTMHVSSSYLLGRPTWCQVVKFCTACSSQLCLKHGSCRKISKG
jgi:hypothetical protein